MFQETVRVDSSSIAAQPALMWGKKKKNALEKKKKAFKGVLAVVAV